MSEEIGPDGSSREAAGEGGRPPNLLLIITDQQRPPMHWPDQPEWVEELLPADAELRRTGAAFENACVASCMCSPSRASLLTGRWPAEHGVELTLTQGGAKIKPENAPAAAAGAARAVAGGEIDLGRAVKMMVRSATRPADGGKGERELDPETPNLATILARAGYRTFIKGKWHLTQPVDGEEWSVRDAERLAEEFSLEGWEPPDAGENIEPEHFGGGKIAGRSKQGFDEDFRRQVEAFLADPPPEPWALVFSLVNPHDVLAYPDSFSEGGYSPSDWEDLEEIGLPPTVDEALLNKPSTHVFQKFGQASFIGGLANDEQRLDYCRFYAHLQRLADRHIGSVVDALGDKNDPQSLRSRTLIVKTSDHGDMGMSHGGLRQKMFNAYEETIRVPLVFSNPLVFPDSVELEVPVSLCDVVPTLASVAGVETGEDGLRGRDLSPWMAAATSPNRKGLAASGVDFGPLEGKGQDPPEDRAVLFAFDDHQCGTAYTDVTPRPNRIRAVRARDSMYAVYFDPDDPSNREYELYDLIRDPNQIDNLVDVATGRVRDPRDEPLRERMALALDRTAAECGSPLPA
ncbi:MAG: sulfatase-like hydrolase/transferase [Solirubrobacterales bacterium]